METGSYGRDLDLSLPELFDMFLGEADDTQFIIEDINPVWLNRFGREILDLAEGNRILGIQSPCQSGSPKVLRKMRRWSHRDSFIGLLNDIKNRKPDLHLATELLFGFPTEEDSDFRETLSLLTEGRFDFTYIYPYYENDFIESSRFSPKCSRTVITKRVEEAVQFCEENRISYCVMKNI
jgi:threonylcarbamoyladenosine tRNA methylthiotransferase CDKAL1